MFLEQSQYLNVIRPVCYFLSILCFRPYMLGDPYGINYQMASYAVAIVLAKVVKSVVKKLFVFWQRPSPCFILLIVHRKIPS